MSFFRVVIASTAMDVHPSRRAARGDLSRSNELIRPRNGDEGEHQPP
jgi:hypothetical protein